MLEPLAVEIERKFLVPLALDWLSDHRAAEIEQGYLAIEGDEIEVRLRRFEERTFLTVKRGQGRRRIETEIEISAEGFAELWPLTEGRRIVKARHYVPSEAGMIEVDVYRGSLEGLIIAEIEFGSEELSESFDPLEWMGAELTGEPAYANKNLATRGAPIGFETGTVDQRRVLSAMFERSRALSGSGGDTVASIRAGMRQPGLRILTALSALEERPDATRRHELSRCCIEYGAMAAAAGGALIDRGALLAQIHPTAEHVTQLVEEETVDRDWRSAEEPVADWRGRFCANQTEIVDGAQPAAGLFDRLIVGLGLTSDLCAWLKDPGMAPSSR